MINKTYVNAIITAAGIGSRMNTDINKQFLTIGNKSVLARTLSKFEKSKYVDKIIIVAKMDKFDYIKNKTLKEITISKDIDLVEGGPTRAESTYNALSSIGNGCDTIVVCHDGARPFISPESIDRMIEYCLDYDSVIYAINETDTIKHVSRGKVIRTLDRDNIVRVQTPQCFKYEILKSAYDKYRADETMTDDSSFIERDAKPVYLLEGSYKNIKITSPEDLIIAKALAKEEDDENR